MNPCVSRVPERNPERKPERFNLYNVQKPALIPQRPPSPASPTHEFIKNLFT
jgi:hypothetical protein